MAKCKYPNLKNAAGEAGVTQREMAEVAGIKPHTFSYRICGHKGDFTVTQAIRIKQAFFEDYTVDELFTPMF